MMIPSLQQRIYASSGLVPLFELLADNVAYIFNQ